MSIVGQVLHHHAKKEPNDRVEAQGRVGTLVKMSERHEHIILVGVFQSEHRCPVSAADRHNEDGRSATFRYEWTTRSFKSG